MGKKYRDLVRAHATAKRSNRTILNILADYADDNGEAWPGYAALAKESGLSERSVIRCISSLIRDGDLEYANEDRGRGHKKRLKIIIKKGDISVQERVTSVQERVTSVQERVTSVQERVTSVQEKGDNGDILTIYRTVIEPYIEPRENRAREDQSAEPAQPPAPSALSQTDVDEFVNATNIPAHALPPSSESPPFRLVLDDPPSGPPAVRRFDPRCLTPGGLWPAGEGKTPYEVYREAFAVTPTIYQIKHMSEHVTDLVRWREVTQQCALRGFMSYSNVFDVYQNGFRKEPSSGNQNTGRSNQAHLARPSQIERRALGRSAVATRQQAKEWFGEDLM